MNKGFTLAELMGVIIILGILSIIVTTVIDRNITESRASSCEAQEQNIIEAAKMYVTDNPNFLPSVGTSKSLTIETLRINNYIDEEMENPMTGEAYNENDYVEITLPTNDQGIDSPKNYTYTVKYANSEDACTE